jgi:5'-deoxynucleotidase YfbR-like HD superfamily hydrolase
MVEPAQIETYTSITFDMLNPTLDMIDIRDIAHAGSLLCRWTGHVKHHYSIAQHELLGSYLVPEENALEFLLHDAAESYVNDMSRPLKHMTDCGKHYRPVEDNIQRLVRLKYGLPEIQSPVIHDVDNAMLLAEKKQLMGNAKWSKELTEDCLVSGIAAQVEIIKMIPEVVEYSFLERFKKLTNRRQK